MMLWGSVIFVFVFVLTVKGDCPCSNATLCQNIQTGPRREMFMFQISQQNWQKYRWKHLTTVILFDGLDNDMLCLAHEHGSRLVWGTGYPVDQLSNSSYREQWIYQWINKVKETYTDGINFDMEDPIDDNSPNKQYFTQLVQETTKAFHTEIPGSQVTVDVAWSPDCIDGRCYDYPGLALASDFLFVMSYDMRSQIYEGPPCLAGSNDPLFEVISGVESFLSLGISPHSLVLGVPWYGYVYSCLSVPDPIDSPCQIASVPFRGVACSDAAGHESSYDSVRATENTTKMNGLGSGRLFDEKTMTPWYWYKDSEGNVTQVWYDDPESLTFKYSFSLKLRGVGVWHADALDYVSVDPVVQRQTDEMWDAITAFV
mmetsp:Transcript_32213/g.44190  ORF Transcript_32213/g.44190 Transcript_32213/m.44190 type:complete len:371 (+) Transcript_32213:29-1141(+)